MNSYKRVVSNKVSQSQPLMGKDMVKNNAGGYVFKLSDMDYVTRFLILGTEGNTYYVGSDKLTADACKTVINVLKSVEGWKAVTLAAEISDSGRAVKNSPAIFLLALAFTHGNFGTKQYAKKYFTKIIRTGSHLLEFASYLDDLRGWGRSVRGAVSTWYNSLGISKLAYQLAKYQNRKEWRQADVLKLAHVKPANEVISKAFKWAVSDEFDRVLAETAIGGKKAVEEAETVKEVLSAISTYRLTWEMVPNKWFSEKEVWRVLLANMPLTAMIRNLNKMTAVGLLASNTPETIFVVDKLSDQSYIRSSRVHPLTIYVAMRQYSSGAGKLGSLTWKPVQAIVSALEAAFYLAFENVPVTNKRLLLALDVSGSMRSASCTGVDITAAEGTAIMSMVTARKSKYYEIMGFSSQFRNLGITASDSLGSAVQKVKDNNFGSTDCALPMIYALKNKIPVDAFIIYTDNETWAGHLHPSVALAQYRKEMNINSKLIVVGMSSTSFTIADPTDKNSLDICGFDTSTPQLIEEFINL